MKNSQINHFLMNESLKWCRNERNKKKSKTQMKILNKPFVNVWKTLKIQVENVWKINKENEREMFHLDEHNSRKKL